MIYVTVLSLEFVEFSWTDRFKNDTLPEVKEERNILLKIKVGKISGTAISRVGTAF